MTGLPEPGGERTQQAGAEHFGAEQAGACQAGC